MTTERKVLIYGKSLRLDIVIPEDKVWEFALAFGQKFMVNDAQGGSHPKAIDGYYYHPNGYHVQVSIPVYEELNFYDFLESFFKERDLPVHWKE